MSRVLCGIVGSKVARLALRAQASELSIHVTLAALLLKVAARQGKTCLRMVK